MRHRADRFLRLTTPVQVWAQRFALLLLLGAAIALIVLNEAKSPLVENLKAVVADTTAPLLSALGEPVDAVGGWVESVGELVVIREENARIRAELEDLQRWQSEARRLQAENQELRALLSMGADGVEVRIGARVLADSGGTFVRSLILNVGKDDGVRKGLAVAQSNALVGRITEIGERTSRVLLVTDLNSRIPVLVESSRDRAILAGDNSRRPKLIFLPGKASVSVGDRIVTSGHGGVFPPGIPVGIVESMVDDRIAVEPLVDWGRLTFVSVLDYLPHGVVMPATAEAEGRNTSEGRDPALTAGGIEDGEGKAGAKALAGTDESAAPEIVTQ